MPVNEIGKVRQSAVIMDYGPGAIVDFRVPGTGAAVSIVSAGLEKWEEKLISVGGSSQDMKRLTERRLSDKLKVSHFRLPPVAPDNPDDDSRIVPLAGARFPGWLQCSRCNSIKPARKWGNEPGNPSRFCNACSTDLPPGQKAYVVPVRFVVACRSGHLDDFPWYDWVHKGSSCPNKREFKLKTDGPGLAGLILSCPRCKNRRSMETIFTAAAHDGTYCSGERPWLVDGKEDCKQKPITIQRGASNLYFPIMVSALVIPPWSEEIIRRLGYRWSEIERITTSEQREQYVDMFWTEIKEDVGDIDINSFKKLVEEKISESRAASSGNLRWDEYRQFQVAAAGAGGKGNEFDVRIESDPARIPHIKNLLRVVSLREIRALTKFTRIEPLPGKPPVSYQYLSKQPLGWLPAIEVRGEGIFFTLESERLRKWENSPAVKERAQQLSVYNESRVINPDNNNVEITPQLGARYLLLHALAHVLMKQLSLQCGYSSASLRERLYIGGEDKEMAGLMIYTSTSDSDGTLGGLQRQGKSGRFAETFIESLRGNEWCSSDPLCIKGLVAATESSNLAACHSCLLSPETSCEDFNRFLDRAMLIGTPEDRSIGFFSDLIGESVK
jgi:uncharacterized protein DUF1998